MKPDSQIRYHRQSMMVESRHVNGESGIFFLMNREARRRIGVKVISAFKGDASVRDSTVPEEIA